MKDIKIEAMLGEMMKEYDENGESPNDIKLNTSILHFSRIILYHGGQAKSYRRHVDFLTQILLVFPQAPALL